MQVDFFAYSQSVNAVPEFGICDDAGKEQPAYVDYDISRQEDWGAVVQSENSQDYSFIAVDNNIIMYCLSATWTKTGKLIRCVIRGKGVPYGRTETLFGRRKGFNRA